MQGARGKLGALAGGFNFEKVVSRADHTNLCVAIDCAARS